MELLQEPIASALAAGWKDDEPGAWMVYDLGGGTFDVSLLETRDGLLRIADGFNGFVAHLANHDVMLWAVSRAPLAKLQAFKRRMGWTVPWASSFESDFNADFSVGITEEQQRTGGTEYNDRREEPPEKSDSEAVPSRAEPPEGPAWRLSSSEPTWPHTGASGRT